ncbi:MULTISPECIES: hypothetical protein [unclassified Streptomyces]|uniref:hypothetical protein n=1 Tax=unclassified Streptomyces TaxID=2593676 RepID=UPI00093E0C6D|nr:hypothetical protein [Streptomyces sp. CB02058]OKI97315.1 hypothetical protein AMK10_00205 [Streptomyces sp. CB02058]
MSTLTELRGPARVVVRQHRSTLRIAGLLALAAAVALIGFALWTSHLIDSFDAGDCEASGVSGPECDQRIVDFNASMSLFGSVLMYAALALTVLPAIISAFVAGPLIARELESGTYRVAWTQSVTPARWLAAKLAVPAVLLVAGVTVLSAVLSWAQTRTATDFSVDWFDGPVFVATVPAVIGYTLLGITVGTLTGLLVHRTVAAMSVATVVTGTVMVVLNLLRESLWPLRTENSEGVKPSGVPLDAWVVDVGRLTSDGRRLPMDVCWPRIDDLQENRCLADHDIIGTFTEYHPSSHLWPLQLVETGIVLVLAAVALAVAFRVLRRLHG